MAKAPLAPGDRAPSLDLPGLAGGTVPVGAAPDRARTLLFFFKVDCPTCPVALPVVETLRQTYGDAVQVIGVSQDDAEATRTAHAGAQLRVALDAGDFAASNAYGLTTVPTLVVLDASGRIESLTRGWSRDAYNAVSRSLAEATGLPYRPASPSDDGRPAWKPG